MNKEYYNIWKFKRAISLINTDPFGVRDLLKEYILEYPLDYCAKNYYTYCLIVINEIDEATNFLLDLEKEVELYGVCAKDKYEGYRLDLISNKIRIMAANEMYQEIYDLINTYPEKLRGNFHSLLSMCKIKLGLMDKRNLHDNMSYLERQMVDYSEDELKRHIAKHFQESNIDYEIDSCVFSIGFNPEKILDEIKKYIPSDKKILSTVISDFYIFRYDDCGRVNGRITDYFKVVCYHNTDKIITICPCYDSENIPHINLNHLVDKKAVNVPSQIEKFNKRLRKVRNN